MPQNPLTDPITDETLCGFCSHPFAHHIRTGDDDHSMWPCLRTGCDCNDFAQPGTVMDLGNFEDN